MRTDSVIVVCCVGFAIAGLAAGTLAPLDYDSAQFALALDQHDLRAHQPQPPGFVTYIWIAKVLRAFTIPPPAALAIVALALSLVAVVALWQLALEAYDRTTARLVVVLFLTSPLVLFHGMTTMTYPAAACITAITALLAHRATRRRDARSLQVLFFTTAVLTGLRQTALVFNAPLLVYAAWRGRAAPRTVLTAVIAWLLGNVAWLIPQIDAADGLGNYLQANRQLHAHLLTMSPFERGLPVLADHLRRSVTVLVFGIGVLRLLAIVPYLRHLKCRGPNQLARCGAWFFVAWILPPFLLQVVYHFPKSGYVLAAWPGICLLLALALRSAWSQSRSVRVITSASIALDIALFFLLPTAHVGRMPWRVHEQRFPGMTATATPRLAWRDAWVQLERAPAAVRKSVRWAFVYVDFFHDRTRDFAFGGFVRAFQAAGFPRADTVLLGQDATRALCYWAPEQTIVHADPLRPLPFLVYANRRGTALHDSYAIPEHVRALLMEPNAGTVCDAGGQPLAGEPLQHRGLHDFQRFDIGAQSVDLYFEPRYVAGGPVVRLHLVRPDHNIEVTRDLHQSTPSGPPPQQAPLQ